MSILNLRISRRGDINFLGGTVVEIFESKIPKIQSLIALLIRDTCFSEKVMKIVKKRRWESLYDKLSLKPSLKICMSGDQKFRKRSSRLKEKVKDYYLKRLNFVPCN